MKFFVKYLTAIMAFLLSQSSFSAKVFVYCSEGSPSGFNPAMVTDGPSFNASAAPIFSRLVEFKPGSTETAPGLAESWEISSDGLQYTFNLRKDVQFHTAFGFSPTRSLNADDVIFSFHRQSDKNHPFHSVSGGHYEYYKNMDMAKIIKEIKKIDAHKVQFILHKKEAPFLADIAMDFASIHSAEYADFLMKKKTPEKIDTEPIGTGPFIFVSYQKDTMIRYQAFDKHWGGRPKIDKLVFAITPDATVRTQKLKTNECQHIAEPSPADLDALRKTDSIKVLGREGINIGYLAMNTEKKPFDNVLVRRAVAHALNRNAYLSSVYLDNATLAKNPIPPSMWSHNDKTKEPEFDLEKSKALLKQAGFPNGFETELWVLPVNRPYNPSGKKMGELMQADLEKVGIKVKLVSYDWPTYLQKTRKGEHSMAQLGWSGDNGDPDNFLNVLLSCAAIEGGGNRARWCHKPFDELIQIAKIKTDQKTRTEAYQKAQVIFNEQTPWVLLAHGKLNRAIRSNVVGYDLHPLGREDFSKVDLK